MPEAAPPAARRTTARHGAPALVLAFDFGARRIGVARGDTVSGTAAPLGFLTAGTAGPPWREIDALMKDWQPALVLVGLPYHLDDSESEQSAASRRFAAELALRYPVKIELVDERYSSIEAHARLTSARRSGERRRRVGKGDIDATAACILLERWLTLED